MPPELQQLLNKADSLVSKAKGAVLIAARDIQKEILYLAGELDIANSAEAREAVFAKVTRRIVKLNKRLASMFEYMDATAVRNAGRTATSETGVDVKMSKAHAREIIHAVTRGGSARLAATMTTSMNNNIVSALRNATVSAFREQAVGGMTMKELQKVLLEKWQAAAKDPANLQFVDKGGRVWDTETYINMNVRTNAMNVYNDALVENIGKATGSDLVMVSSGGDPNCRLCFPWEGRILSITGRTRGFPTYAEAKEAGLFHPNCVHTLEPVDEELDAAEIDLQRQFTPPEDMTPKAMDDQRYEIDINRKMLNEGMTATQAKVAVDRDNLENALRQGLAMDGADKIVDALTDEQVNALCPDGNPPEFLPQKDNDGEAQWRRGTRGGVFYIDKKGLSAERVARVADIGDGKPVEKPEVKVAEPPKGESEEDALERALSAAESAYENALGESNGVAAAFAEESVRDNELHDAAFKVGFGVLEYAKGKGKDEGWVKDKVADYQRIFGVADMTANLRNERKSVMERNRAQIDELKRKWASTPRNDPERLDAFRAEAERLASDFAKATGAAEQLATKLVAARKDALAAAEEYAKVARSVIDALTKEPVAASGTMRDRLTAIGVKTDKEASSLKELPIEQAIKKTSALNALPSAEDYQKEVQAIKDEAAEKERQIRGEYREPLHEIFEGKKGVRADDEGNTHDIPFAERIERRRATIERMGLEREFRRFLRKNSEELIEDGYTVRKFRYNYETHQHDPYEYTYTHEEVEKHNASVYYRFLAKQEERINKEMVRRINAVQAERDMKKSMSAVSGLLVDKGEQSSPVVTAPDSRKDYAEKMKAALSRLVHKDVLPARECFVEAIRGRAFQRKDRIHLSGDDGVEVYLHEYAHFIEEYNPHVHERCQEFLAYRTKGETTERLKDISYSSYRPDELCVKDKFFDPYCGKIYNTLVRKGEAPVVRKDGKGYSVYATEVLSMGIQRVFTDARKFAEEDREYFDFVMNVLRGVI